MQQRIGRTRPPDLNAVAFTAFALVMFAANSLPCHPARGGGSVDAGDPLMRNARSFQWATLTGLLMFPPPVHDLRITPQGAALASASGAIASALGHVSGYAALRVLAATMASILQLSVAVLTAVGGVLFLSGGFTRRPGLSSMLVPGGVAQAQVGRRAQLTSNTTLHHDRC